MFQKVSAQNQNILPRLKRNRTDIMEKFGENRSQPIKLAKKFIFAIISRNISTVEVEVVEK